MKGLDRPQKGENMYKKLKAPTCIVAKLASLCPAGFRGVVNFEGIFISPRIDNNSHWTMQVRMQRLGISPKCRIDVRNGAVRYE
jgi:hypothetical protein